MSQITKWEEEFVRLFGESPGIATGLEFELFNFIKSTIVAERAAAVKEFRERVANEVKKMSEQMEIYDENGWKVGLMEAIVKIENLLTETK